VTDDDTDEYGDVYTLRAMETDAKLFISHHEGGRSTDNAIDLFNDLESRRLNLNFKDVVKNTINQPNQCMTYQNINSFAIDSSTFP
jgi:hypothetical protein